MSLHRYNVRTYTHTLNQVPKEQVACWSFRQAKSIERELAQANFVEKTEIYSTWSGRTWTTLWPRFTENVMRGIA